jgi:hypothetical protein
MRDVGELLRDADPLVREERVPPDEASRMRRAIVAAARDRSTDVPGWWPTPMLVAATVAVALAAGVSVERWLPRRDRAIADAGATTASMSTLPAASRERRQLQFASPGGTRIIWVFDSDFNP